MNYGGELVAENKKGDFECYIGMYNQSEGVGIGGGIGGGVEEEVEYWTSRIRNRRAKMEEDDQKKK